MSKERRSFTIPSETCKRLDELAQKEDRTISNMVSILLKEAMDNRKNTDEKEENN